MTTVALEVIPPTSQAGSGGAIQVARNVKHLVARSGLADRVNTLVIPQIVPEDEGRPVPLEERMDPIDFSGIVAEDIPASLMLSQVTVLTPPEALEARLQRIRDEGIERVVFVGVSRNLDLHHPDGLSPSEAMRRFRRIIPSRGVILIPTREGERERFREKLEADATFAVTQLLFSDQVGHFLRDMSEHPQRPEIILSFAYVPRGELTKGLLRWLIRDNAPGVQQESETVARIAGLPFKDKKLQLVDIYKRVLARAEGLGYPLGLHFECPYGISEPALEVFSTMLDSWSPT